MDRDGLSRTLKEIARLDNPLTYDRLLTMCPQHERLVIQIIDSELLLGVILHRDDDPKYPHCIELVKIINPKELDL